MFTIFSDVVIVSPHIKKVWYLSSFPSIQHNICFLQNCIGPEVLHAGISQWIFVGGIWLRLFSCIEADICLQKGSYIASIWCKHDYVYCVTIGIVWNFISSFCESHSRATACARVSLGSWNLFPDGVFNVFLSSFISNWS